MNAIRLNNLRRCQTNRNVRFAASNFSADSINQNDMHLRQQALFAEASSITRALYKRCLKSINVMAKGNERDEIEFTERENASLSQFDDTSTSSTSLMSPPVNRANELSSRANYYFSFCRENFEGHWDLLGVHGFNMGTTENGLGLGHVVGGQGSNHYEGGHHHLGVQISSQCVGKYGDASTERNNRHYTWSEDQIEKFVYLIRSGEEKRTWILNDYEFDDPCLCSDWPNELERRLNKFEEGANLLVKEIYKERGWVHSSDAENMMMDDEDEESDDEDEL